MLVEGVGDQAPASGGLPEISIDEFFRVPIAVKDHRVLVEGAALLCAGTALGARQVKDGQVR